MEANWQAYYNGNASATRTLEWFKQSGDFNDTEGKSLDSCGNSLPSSLKPICDPFLGLTQGCECRGKKVVNFVTVKPLDLDKDAKAVRNAANVAAFASGAKMAEKVSSAKIVAS